MKCALIVPAWTPHELFPSQTAGSQINYWQPLGILYVAACLLRAGHRVRFYDGGFVRRDEMLRQVSAFDPDFAGIYATAFGWDKAKKTAADLKRLNKNIFTCAGGPYPIAAQERCLADDGGSIDAAVTGEGELTVREMLDRLERGASLEDVAGVVFRHNGSIIKNAPRPLIEDLDSLPFPARELLGDAARYIPPPGTYRRKPVATLITSRGCNRRCLFCFQIDRARASGIRGVRYRSIGNVLEEIELLLEQGYREIKFLDDSLASDYDRAMELARRIKARGLRFAWFASACANQVDQSLLQAFREAGCWAILLGAESGVQKNLNTLRKATTLEQIRHAVRAAKEIGLRVSTPFVFGIPGETFEEGLKTIEFAVELDADLANFHALTPFPGTDLHDHHAKFGTISRDLADYTYQGAAFAPYTMTREQIQQLRQIAFRRFYSRPSFLVKKLFAMRNLSDCQAALGGMTSLFWLWAKKGVFQQR
ncbi:MAG: B12-binding domain-containing radical SAM protein [Betaproteobacteria bacterium RIFCSPLOWO2_12_FULL_62_13]|nr:MAG: B12-binding domain-containing radical SAM protein [Betaproteobacteria bacterium RIFCSPLOWO2_12_FULL_62_13]